MNPTFELERQAKAAMLIKQAVEASGQMGDEELLIDCIEAETELLEQVDALLVSDGDARAMAAALDMQIREMQTRKKRFERKSEMIRFLLLQVVQAVGVRKLERAPATISLMAGRKSVSIFDENELPEQFFRITKEPSKTAIKEALDSGQAVPGAAFVVGEETLAVRRG